MYSQSSILSNLNVTWSKDVFASFMVVLVTIPFSIAIAIASGIPVEKTTTVGLVSAMIGAIIVGCLSGSVLQVSGPSTGLALLVFQYIQEHGFEAISMIVIIAALIQLIAGLMSLERVFCSVSPVLIQGVFVGIGILIVVSQIHVMLDYLPLGSGKKFAGIINLLALPETVWKSITDPSHQSAAIIGLLTISTTILWSVFTPVKFRFLPSPLVGVVAAILCAALFDMNVNFVPSPVSVLNGVNLPTTNWCNLLVDHSIWVAGLSLAFVASAETVLTATLVDSMQSRTKPTDYNKEFTAQGVGNIVCGLLHVLPITGVISRSASNVMAGCRTRLSVIFQGVWILLFILILPATVEFIPLASLAAILIYEGMKLIKIHITRTIWSQDRSAIAIYLTTVLTIVMVDLLTGISVGICLAIVKIVYLFFHFEVIVEDKQNLNDQCDRSIYL